MSSSHQSSEPYAAAVAPKPKPPPKSRWRYVWRTLAVLGVLLVALAAGLWWWAGSGNSLATALDRAARYLPEGQQLQAEGVTGSLRTGGHIDHLRWSNDGLSVEADDVDVGWSLGALLQRQLKLGEVHASSITIRQLGEAKPDEGPPEPLNELVLPLQVDLPFRIDHLIWAGRGDATQPLAIDDLAGHYGYDGNQHRLRIDHVEVAQGRYSLDATLGARAPMPLEATLKGSVRAQVPGSEETVHAQADARVTGTLSGREARLQATAQLRGGPQDPDADAPLRADVQARIAPWLAQPLEQAQADMQGLDLALFWPQAPTTQLAGTAAVQPEGENGWRISADLRNARPGPWDKQHLPVEAVRAQASYDGSTWDVPEAHLRAGGGTVDARGRYTPATQALEGQARLANVNPAQLHTRLAPLPLSGTASASGNAAGDDAAVRFAADLRAAGAPRRTGAADAAVLALQRLSTQGRWHGKRVDVTQLLVQAQGAEVRAQNLSIDTQALAASGRVQAELPGASAQASGEMAPASGAGTLAVRISDAQRVQRWLGDLGVPAAGVSLDGRAQLDAQWRGGWQSAQRQLQAAGLLPAEGASAAKPGDFSLQAQLRTPRLLVSRAAEPGSGSDALALELTRTSAALRGSLADLALDFDGLLRQNNDLQADLHLRASAGSSGAGRWQGRVNELRVQASMKDQPGPWTLLLAEPVELALQQQPRLQMQAGAASARLTGPEPGQVQLRWQPLRYAQGAQGGMELTSQGTLQGLPLAWANAFKQDGQGALARLGVSGDLVLAGAWDVAATDAGLRARASVRRSGGDIRMATGAQAAPGAPTVVHSSGEGKGAGAPKAQGAGAGTAAGPVTSAGLRELALEVTAEGEDVRARLSWDSERAGRVQAEGSTRLAHGTDGAWQWPEDAPLAANIHAALPEVGVWSMLAPPGWRVHGTLNADVRLSGSRAAPRWNGELAADRFAIRSVLDGVDLQDGRLRATLQGEQLTITELHLKGGRGSRARIAGFSGNRTAAPLDGGTLDGSGTLSWTGATGQGKDAMSSIRMDLRAQARQLQVLVRADRQVSVSGDLRARLEQGQVVLRGDLSVDRATIILPEAGAPALGDDVVVHSAALDRAAAEKAQQAAQRSQGREQPGSVQAARTPDVAVSLDLGQDFAVQGRGVTTRLTGKLDITANAASSGQPRVTGEVRTDQGRYRAWGQALDIETGLLRFNGPYDNPALDVLALRPNIAVRAGVQVSGSAKSPNVRLYSEPELPDAEKLSWVVLGRSAAAGGAEAALLQQAALAFLSGNGDKSSGGIAQKLGLDEIGFKGPGQGEGAAGAALTFGKRLSRDLYVTYEKSLSGALGTLFIFYDLSKRLTLRGQTGEQSAVDLIYTVRYD
ncbi:DUF490 domain-containing protein [Melaminivora suipulveris]|uniref:DUF490 domain-containing protein n=1 Tax=Melaminivora suipulveris TaxID=2109913 RepID=A0A2R3QDW5_9BURK|nr:translocation/assembly module TamB domain-containing protein [Melaminivora suipulveris]AVO49962.1 DUF490 domain-containing protein [Melaminivora suipulveris]